MSEQASKKKEADEMTNQDDKQYQHQIDELDDLKRLWRNADCVCFDVDSTVCVNEAIDDLAHFAGVGDQVKQL